MPSIPHEPHYLEGREELIDHLVTLHGFDRKDLRVDPEPLVTKHAREHSKPMADPTGPVAQAAHLLEDLLTDFEERHAWPPDAGVYAVLRRVAAELVDRIEAAERGDLPAGNPVALAGQAEWIGMHLTYALEALRELDPAFASDLARHIASSLTVEFVRGEGW